MHDEQPTAVTQLPNKQPVTPPPRLGYMDLSKLRADPENVRKHFNDIDAFAETIRRDGIIQPLLVCPSEDGTYLVVAGNRRFLAAQKAGLTQVPVFVKSIAEENKVAVQLIENIQRSDLSAVEIAASLAKLIEVEPPRKERLERVGARLGKSANWVSRHTALLKLDPRVVKAIEYNQLGISQAAEVARLARANQIPQAIELAAAMKTGQVKRADARAQPEKTDPSAIRVRILERSGDGFSVHVTFTSMHEAREATFRADLEQIFAAYGGAQ